MRGVLVLAGGLLAVGTVTASWGQSTTGSLAGTVVDETGGVVAGVSAVLTGDHVVGSLESLTDEQGRFRFPSLPPGSYDVSFAQAGFVTLHHRGLRVRLGGAQELNVSLQRTSLHEEVTVTGESPPVDTRSSEVGAHYDEGWIRNAPGRRVTFFDLINSAPGVSADSSTGVRSTSLGGNSNENAYLLDGTDFTAPATGAAWPWPNVDAIGEVEIVTLGAPAEYGNLQGAVFNVVTRQGSNAFHGDVNFYFQDQALTGRNTTAEEDGGLPYHRTKYHDLTLQFSGPVLKDKLWFFGSYQHQRDLQSRSGTDPDFPGLFQEDRVFFKLNWQVSARSKLMMAYHDEVPYRLSPPGAANIAPSAISVDEGSVPTPNLTFTRTLSERAVLEIRYSGFYGRDHVDPLDGGPRTATRFWDLDRGEVSGGIRYWYDQDVWRTALSAKMSHFADDFLGGDHDFKFGVQYYRGGYEAVVGYNDYVYTYAGYDGPAGYGYTRLPFHYGSEMESLGFYADDSFRVTSRLTLNTGLRYDRSRAFYRPYPILEASGRETGTLSPGNDRLFDWDTLSPRIGINWKVTADGNTVLRGHYGRYARGIISREYDQVVPSISPVWSGTWDFGTGAFDPESLTLSDPSTRRVDPGFRGSYTDQFLIGFEREMFTNVVLAVHGTYKRGSSYGGWSESGGRYEAAVYVDDQGQDATGRSIRVVRLVTDPAERDFVLTNPEGMFTRFKGLVVQATKRMSHGWQLDSSLTIGRSTGRVGSSNQSAQNTQSGLANDFGQNPNDFVNTDEGLIADRTTAFKAQLLVRLPGGLLAGASYTYQSGRPWARKVRVQDLGLFTTILADPIDGHRRLPSWNLLDLRLQKEVRLGRGVKLALFADVLNVFNDDAYEWVESELGTSDNFGKPAGFVAPRRAMLGAKIFF